MNCEEARPEVSTLYDGEEIPSEAAAHIAACANCQERLRDYSALGAELRLLASQGESEARATLPAIQVEPRKTRWAGRWTRRVTLPRFAVGLAAIAVVALLASSGWLRARPEKPWFQFDLEMKFDGGVVRGHGVQSPESSESEHRSVMFLQDVGIEVNVVEVRDNGALLKVRAVKVPVGMPAREGYAALQRAQPREYWYVVGERLPISVEGSGSIWLTGEILSEKPKYIGRMPKLDLDSHEIALHRPVLMRGKEVLGEFTVSGSAQGMNPTIALYLPGHGLWLIALEPFPNAERGEAEWGRARFRIQGEEFQLFSQTPITGGSQPRTIWVQYDPDYRPSQHGADFKDSSQHAIFGAMEGIRKLLRISP